MFEHESLELTVVVNASWMVFAQVKLFVVLATMTPTVSAEPPQKLPDGFGPEGPEGPT